MYNNNAGKTDSTCINSIIHDKHKHKPNIQLATLRPLTCSDKKPVVILQFTAGSCSHAVSRKASTCKRTSSSEHPY